MRSRLSTIAAGASAGIVMLAALLTPGVAHATTPPPWEPDSNAAGQLNFFDASGNPLTSGSIQTVPFAAYAVGTTTVRDGDTKALLDYAQPNPSVANTSNWSVAAISAVATTYPVPAGGSVPTSISSLDSTHPVATGSALDNSLENQFAGLPNTGTAAYSDGIHGCAYMTSPTSFSQCTNTSYQNLYQIRLLTTNGVTNSSSYDDAVIAVDPTTLTWTQVYPAPFVAGVTTTTTLSPSPSSPVVQGTSVTLTASINASDSSSPAGAVQFKEDGTAIGSPVPVDTGTETAHYTATFNPGQHSFTATFAPTDGTTYSGSTSDPLPFLVNPKAKAPTITGIAQVGHTVTCNEPTTLGEAAAFTWKLNGTAAHTGRTFALPGTAAGKSLTCTVKVSVTGGTASSATSAAKKVAVGAALKNTSKPAIVGKARVGKTVKVSNGSWSPKPTGYSYQWLLNGKAIAHATKSSFKIVKKDKGKKLSCKVTAKKTGYRPGAATSKSVTVKK